MTLPWKVRALVRTQGLLGRLGVLPDAHSVLRKPAAERTAMAAPSFLVGPVPDVAWADASVATRDGGAVRVRLYRPADASSQPVLYLHGGGFALGGIAASDHVCKRLAAESGAVVVSVEYRLAPEHRFPVPLHDCLDALAWLQAESGRFGLDLERLVVAGDSAGGNLAAAIAVVLRDEGRPLAGQLLIYPGVDLSLSLPGVRAYAGAGLSTADVQLCADTYLGDHDPTDPHASPWYAAATGLAPAYVLTVGHDPLRGEGLAYAEKLRAAGVPVTALDLPDHAHGSLSTPRLYADLDTVYAGMAAFLRSVAVSRAA